MAFLGAIFWLLLVASSHRIEIGKLSTHFFCVCSERGEGIVAEFLIDESSSKLKEKGAGREDKQKSNKRIWEI